MPADEPLNAALVERVARGICAADGFDPDEEMHGGGIACRAWQYCFDTASAALLSLGIPAEALNALARGEATVTPNVPTEDQWGGLARDIMMWLDMARHSSGSPKPRDLFEHLENLGRPAPQWLKDEPELKHLDHVPSKGTRCVIIFRAMLAASPYARKEDSNG